MEFQFILLVLTAFAACKAAPNYDMDFSEVHYEGGFALFPVKRDAVQQRLDEFNGHVADDDVKLYLPSGSPVHHEIKSDEHVIMIAFGTETAVEFDEALTDQQKASLSTITKGVWINIPYLSMTDGGKPEITLQMKSFHEDAGESIEANTIFPPAKMTDSLSQTLEGNKIDIRLDVEEDDLQMHLTGQHNEPCTFPGEEVLEDVNEYERELQISQSGPNFEICDRFSDLDVAYCDLYRDQTYAEILNGAGTNVCQYWKPKINVKSCKASLQIESMSDEMRELLLLANETQDAVEAEIQTGNYDIRLVFPCIE